MKKAIKGVVLATARVLFFNLLIGGALADTHYVSPIGTNDVVGLYTNWAGAATQIQSAVSVASSNDTVLVSDGTYTLTNQIIIAQTITLKSLNGTNVTFINGNYPITTNRCIYVNNKAVVIDGFTITNGFATYGYSPSDTNYTGGGGVMLNLKGTIRNCVIQNNICSNGSPYAGGGGVYLYGQNNATDFGTISNCTIAGNTVLNSAIGAENRGGGGIYVYANGMIRDSVIMNNTAAGGGGGVKTYGGAGVVISNCTVSGNTSLYPNYYAGGGISLNGGKVLQCVIASNTAASGGFGGGAYLIAARGSSFVNNIISNNTAGNGGGVAIEYGATISNCTVTLNSASASGGGLYVDGSWGPYTVANCVISANKSGNSGGGGLWCQNNGYLRNCLICCNTNSGDRGGGVYANNISDMKYGVETGAMVNCTIVSNQAHSRGAGVYANGVLNRYQNCIVYGNVSTTSGAGWTNIYNELPANTNNYGYCLAPDLLPPNQGNITGNPLFVDPANGNYRLSAGSPCVNAGTNLSWMTRGLDLSGTRRIIGPRVDIGAYERYYLLGTMMRVN